MLKRKNPHAVELGKLGAAKGGRARARKLTPEQRSEGARVASMARWERYQEQQRDAKGTKA